MTASSDPGTARAADDADDAAATDHAAPTEHTALSRRHLLGLGGAAGVGGLALGAGGTLLADIQSSHTPLTRPAAGTVPAAAAGNQRVAFHGVRQSGITAPPQALGYLVAFDLKPQVTRAQVTTLLRSWSAIAAAAMAGEPVPGDDAMAHGRGPGALTVTFGFGASLLGRISLAAQVPEPLAPLPAFVGDRLDPAASGGDLCVLVAGNDALVVVHALRALQRAAADTAAQRWQVNGFTDAPGALPTATATPRNLMGQLDGTGNPVPGTSAFDQAVYVPADARPAWMRDGTYLVYRRIRILLNDWDTLDRAAQEAVIGRSKATGAPLSGGTEFTPADFTRQNPDGSLAIPAEAHIRQASAQNNSGAVLLRRSFSYYAGALPDGSPDAGLLFLAYQADPRTAFTVIQQRLSQADTLSTFIRHEASALFAIPPSCPPGGYIGRELLEPT